MDRALCILEALADNAEPITLSDLSAKVGLNISTVHRLLATMAEHDFVQQEPETNCYKLGLKVFKIGNAALYDLDLRALARPFLRELVRLCNETVNLVVLDGQEVVYIDQVESTNIVKMIARIGERGPAHATAAGKMLLAGLPARELERLLQDLLLPRLTDKTIASIPELLQELDIIRRRLFFRPRRHGRSTLTAAAPVFNHEGRVIAAISVSGPSMRVTPEMVENVLVPLVTKAAEAVSHEIGFRGVTRMVEETVRPRGLPVAFVSGISTADQKSRHRLTGTGRY